MLSKDELSGGITFILKSWDADGVPLQWVESLRGDVARHWYDLYRESDWDAVRLEAPGVFHNRVTADDAERARRADRCVVIRTPSVPTGP